MNLQDRLIISQAREYGGLIWYIFSSVETTSGWYYSAFTYTHKLILNT